MKIAVFGGTGFIGSRIIESLVQQGHRVSALARNQEKAELVRSMGATPFIGDLERRDTYCDAIRESELVVNAAFPSFLGRMTMRRARRDAQRGFLQMQSLLETIAGIGSIPVILTEGAMAFGDSRGTWLDENSPYTFDKGHGRLLKFSVPYAQQMRVERQMPMVTISLAGVYGPGSWFKESVYAYIKKGKGMVVGDGTNVWSFVHVDDVAEAYRRAVERLPIGETMTLADDDPCTYVDFANYVADQLGRPHVKHMPQWLADVLLGRVLSEALTMNQRIRNGKAKRLLDWQPRYPSWKEGIATTLVALEQARAS